MTNLEKGDRAFVDRPFAFVRRYLNWQLDLPSIRKDNSEAKCRGFRFMVQVVINPASLLETGIQVERVDQLSLFRFTDVLQSRLETLLEKNEMGSLTPEESEELTGIQELDRIFTYLNSRLIAQG
jgi:hypothetical protein